MSSEIIDRNVDRSSYIPFYIQVIDELTEYIEENDFSPGHQLPAEADLCRAFDVSRTVIRHALQEMEYKGLIYREKGRGTFVAKPKIHESFFQELTGFYQDMVARGYQPKSDVLKQEKTKAGPKIAGYLEIAPNTPLIHIDRLRYVNHEPIVYVSTYLPYQLCPSLLEVDLSDRSLYAYLESEYDLQIASGKRFLDAVVANEIEADLLQVDVGAPLMLLDSVSYLEDGTPIEYYHALHRGDRSRFEVELVRVDETGGLTKKIINNSTQ